MKRDQSRVRTVALMGMLFSLAMTLSFFESFLAGLMALPPGIKPGLSNIVVIFAMLSLGRREAFLLALLKAGFVLLTRGAIASLLSLSGGLLSVAVMALLAGSARVTVGCRLLSVLGGVSHNTAQLAVAALLIGNHYLLYYLPVLLLAGILTGLLTGSIYLSLEPYLKRLFDRPQRRPIR